MTIKQLMEKFEQAAIVKSWKGGCDPADWDEIDREYDRAKDALLKAVVRLRVACNEVIAFSTNPVPEDTRKMVVDKRRLDEMAKAMNGVN